MTGAPGDFSFGSVAIKLGFTTLQRVDEVLGLQEKKRERGGVPLKMGEMMVRLGYLTEDQVHKVLLHMGAHRGHEEIPGYRLIAKIGQGATGSIYQAHQISMDRTVAIKVLASRHAAAPAIRDRFLREARAAARLNHANLIQGIDVNVANGIHYYAMEYIDGPSVADLLRRGGALDEKKAVGLATQAAKALAHAYRHGILHRDLKPQNLLVTRDGILKLCDFGFTPAESRGGGPLPYYASPEQIRGESEIDTRSDIYSLGATLFHMVTGDVPFPADSADRVKRRHLEDPVPSPRAKNSGVSPKFDWVIRKMMAKRREMRYPTPPELLKDLEAIASGGVPQGYAAESGLRKSEGPNTRLRRLSRGRRYRS